MLLIHLIYQNIHENLARKIDTMDFGFYASASAISEYINKLGKTKFQELLKLA
jgi:predicted nucleic acid-binding protein